MISKDLFNYFTKISAQKMINVLFRRSSFHPIFWSSEFSFKIGKKSMMKIGIILLLITLIITTISHITLTKASLSGVQKKEYEPEIFGNIWSKKVEIFSNDGKEYSYIPVLVSVPENVDNIESYKRFSDGIQQRISSNKDYSFKKLDRDDDGKVDYILDLNGFKITQHHFLLLFIKIGRNLNG